MCLQENLAVNINLNPSAEFPVSSYLRQGMDNEEVFLYQTHRNVNELIVALTTAGHLAVCMGVGQIVLKVT